MGKASWLTGGECRYIAALRSFIIKWPNYLSAKHKSFWPNRVTDIFQWSIEQRAMTGKSKNPSGLKKPAQSPMCKTGVWKSGVRMRRSTICHCLFWDVEINLLWGGSRVPGPGCQLNPGFKAGRKPLCIGEERGIWLWCRIQSSKGGVPGRAGGGGRRGAWWPKPGGDFKGEDQCLTGIVELFLHSEWRKSLMMKSSERIALLTSRPCWCSSHMPGPPGSQPARWWSQPVWALEVQRNLCHQEPEMTVLLSTILGGTAYISQKSWQNRALLSATATLITHHSIFPPFVTHLPTPLPGFLSSPPKRAPCTEVSSHLLCAELKTDSLPFVCENGMWRRREQGTVL